MFSIFNPLEFAPLFSSFTLFSFILSAADAGLTKPFNMSILDAVLTVSGLVGVAFVSLRTPSDGQISSKTLSLGTKQSSGDSSICCSTTR